MSGEDSTVHASQNGQAPPSGVLPGAGDVAGIFRERAVEYHRRGRLRGDVLHITPGMLHAVQWLVLAIAAVGLAFVCTAEVRKYSTGPAVVLLEQRHEVTANRAGVVEEIRARIGQRVRAGDVLIALRAPNETSELASAQRELDDQLILLMQRPEDADARASVLALRTRRDLAEASLERSLVRAPQAGEVADLRARVGQLIEAGAPLLAVQAEPRSAQITALLPGADRPRLRPGMPLTLRIDGFERTHLELRIDRVDEQVLGPAEALRALGTELSGALDVQGPLVLVHARLPADGLRARGVAYRLHHGMPARAEVAVDREPLLYAWLPGLSEALSDVF